MKIIIFSALLCLLSGLLHAQQWHPVPSTEWFHYSADTAGYPTHLLTVDSTVLAGPDTIFHLSPTHVPNGPAEWFKQSFLGRTATVAPGGVWTLIYDTSQIVLHVLAQPGAQWTWGNGHTATVLSATDTLLFGIADSVKTIAADSDTLLLSRQFGLLHFPARHGEQGFTLTGVDHGRTAGEQVPDLFDYYDFSPGDVFYRKAYNAYFDGQLHEDGVFRKTTILAKTVVNDTLTEYEAEVVSISYILTKNMGGMYYPSYNFYSAIQDTLRIHPSSEDVNLHYIAPFNHRPNVFHRGPATFGGLGSINRISQDGAGHTEFTQYPGFFTHPDIEDFASGVYEFNGSSGMDRYMDAYAVGLGQTLFFYHVFELSASDRLLGYVKNGVQWGEVPTNEYLRALPVETQKEIAFTLSPNPAHAHLVLTLTGGAQPGTATLSDLQGREVLSAALSGGTARLETSELPAGMYLLRVQTDTGTATQKVVIQH